MENFDDSESHWIFLDNFYYSLVKISPRSFFLSLNGFRSEFHWELHKKLNRQKVCYLTASVELFHELFDINKVINFWADSFFSTRKIGIPSDILLIIIGFSLSI